MGGISRSISVVMWGVPAIRSSGVKFVKLRGEFPELYAKGSELYQAGERVVWGAFS